MPHRLCRRLGTQGHKTPWIIVRIYEMRWFLHGFKIRDELPNCVKIRVVVLYNSSVQTSLHNDLKKVIAKYWFFWKNHLYAGGVSVWATAILHKNRGEERVSSPPWLAVSHTSHVTHASVLTPKWRLFDRKVYFYSAYPRQKRPQAWVRIRTALLIPRNRNLTRNRR